MSGVADTGRPPAMDLACARKQATDRLRDEVLAGSWPNRLVLNAMPLEYVLSDAADGIRALGPDAGSDAVSKAVGSCRPLAKARTGLRADRYSASVSGLLGHMPLPGEVKSAFKAYLALFSSHAVHQRRECCGAPAVDVGVCQASSRLAWPPLPRLMSLLRSTSARKTVTPQSAAAALEEARLAAVLCLGGLAQVIGDRRAAYMKAARWAESVGAVLGSGSVIHAIRRYAARPEPSEASDTASVILNALMDPAGGPADIGMEDWTVQTKPSGPTEVHTYLVFAGTAECMSSGVKRWSPAFYLRGMANGVRSLVGTYRRFVDDPPREERSLTAAEDLLKEILHDSEWLPAWLRKEAGRLDRDRFWM